MREQLYKTPEGKVDIPFFYVFDPRSLTNGTSPAGLTIPIREHDFLVRSAVGMSTVASDWLYYNPSDSPAMGSGDVATSGFAQSPIATSPRFTVVPEKFFPANSQIKFDLGTVALALNDNDVEISLMGFQGVKRAGEGQWGWATYRTPYQYWERPKSYQITVNVNFFADQGAAPRPFVIPVSDSDFELQMVAIQEVTEGEIGALPADPFWITLYDPSGYNALSNLPISPRWLNYFQGGNFFSCFPAPTLVYPVNAEIKFDILSLINVAGGNRQFQFSFQGVNREPC